MKQNVGPIDKAIRLILAVVLFALLFLLQGNLRWLGLIGIVPLMTALLGTCPLYALIGVNSCPKVGPK